MQDLSDRIAQAIGDPGSVVGPRLGPSWGVGHTGYAEQQESVPRWGVRAVLAVLAAEPACTPDAGTPDDDPMPVFVLKAQDRLAVYAMEAYFTACRDEDEDLAWQADQVREAIAEFEEWQRRNPDRVKLPDHQHVPVAAQRSIESTQEMPG